MSKVQREQVALAVKQMAKTRKADDVSDAGILDAWAKELDEVKFQVENTKHSLIIYARKMTEAFGALLDAEGAVEMAASHGRVMDEKLVQRIENALISVGNATSILNGNHLGSEAMRISKMVDRLRKGLR